MTRVSQSQLKSQAKYDAQHTVRMGIKLNKKTDADIIELLENAPSKNGLIREALRQMIKKS